MTGSTFGNSYLGRIVKGFIKLGIAIALFGLLNTVTGAIDLSNATIGGTTVNLQVVVDVVRVFAPIALVVSALRDFGIEL